MQSKAQNDPLEVVELVNQEAGGPALILCEHASAEIPARFNDLGLAPEDRYSHAVWDPGARSVALKLAEALESPMIACKVSRLVYDCNRPPGAPGAIAAQSELISVPGNANLSQAQLDERQMQVYQPFCSAVTALIEQRARRGLTTALITVHSFTPTYYGQARPVEIGILHDSDQRMADVMLTEAGRLPHRRVERNQPYGPADGVTHSLKIHGIAHGLANVMIEIRNDLITNQQEEEALANEVLTLMQPYWQATAKPEARHA
jgi:predicted N-formylglutamate amidohydrolase